MGIFAYQKQWALFVYPNLWAFLLQSKELTFSQSWFRCLRHLLRTACDFARLSESNYLPLSDIFIMWLCRLTVFLLGSCCVLYSVWDWDRKISLKVWNFSFAVNDIVQYNGKSNQSHRFLKPIEKIILKLNNSQFYWYLMKHFSFNDISVPTLSNYIMFHVYIYIWDMFLYIAKCL